MQATLAELVALVHGRLVGDGNLTITGASPLDDAAAGEITMVDRLERAHLLDTCKATAVIVPHSVTHDRLAVIQVDDVHQAFASIVSRFRPPRSQQRIGISPLALVSPKAKLGEGVDVYPYATIGEDVEIGEGSTIFAGVHIMAGCKIGPHVTIFPNVVLYENCVIGPRCLVHAGAVIGAYGFGYGFSGGCYQLSAQLGNVVIGADVEIGAGSTIDRGTYGSTIIGEGTKIDNQVMVAHNCHIGKHNMLCAQVGIAGSTSTGDYVVMAGQVGVRDHVRIGARAVLGAMAGVINDIPADARVVGIPATPEREQMIKQAALAKLPEMRRQLKRLDALVEQLTKERGLVKANGKAKDEGRRAKD
jgi:UDP-3-O-[3-hydroxymyristoyl] glucosamine N-acyltransferase